jgi:hypothetical protein
MTRGAYRTFFRVGLVGMAAGLLAPWLSVPAAIATLLGIAAYEHAYIQAGQAVPLA